AEPEVQVIEPRPLFAPFVSRPSKPVAESDDVDDSVIVGKLLGLFENGLTDTEATSELLKEFDLSDDDVKELLKLAREKQSNEIYEANREADELRKAAGDALNRALQAEVQVKRNKLEKHFK